MQFFLKTLGTSPNMWYFSSIFYIIEPSSSRTIILRKETKGGITGELYCLPSLQFNDSDRRSLPRLLHNDCHNHHEKFCPQKKSTKPKPPAQKKQRINLTVGRQKVQRHGLIPTSRHCLTRLKNMKRTSN